MWESAFSCLAFVKVLWPDFSIWHLYSSILHYQRNYRRIQIARENNVIERKRILRESDLNCVREERERAASRNQSAEVNSGLDQGTLQSQMQQYSEMREKRVADFLAMTYLRRQQKWESRLPTFPDLGAN